MKPAKTVKPPHLLGAGLLLTVFVLVFVIKAFDDPGPHPPGPNTTVVSQPVTPTLGNQGLTLVTGYGGGLKKNFFDDPAIASILAQRYGIQVNLVVQGSIQAMCQTGLDGIDFLWVGDQSSLSIYTDQCGGSWLGETNIYNSPLVLYSWTPVVEALSAAGVATQTGDVFTVDTTALVDLVVQGRRWTSIGLSSLNGPIQIRTTDPMLSNSGFLYAGLVACVLNDRQPPTQATVGPLLPEIQAIFQNQGYMPGTSADFFQQFLSQNMGANPIAAGYESQLLEYLISNPSQLPYILANIRMLYPQPTVWASHPFIARTNNGMRLMNALKDPDIQSLALTHHGNRPGVPSVPTVATPASYPGYLGTIASVCGMPASDEMERILRAISTSDASATATHVTPATPSSAATRGSG